PKGMSRSLYLKDDDYRLSFLYGNFTTLTRFTEMDLERVVTQRLGPLFVSIHTTDPDLRAKMLRNPRGAISLRWLRALLDHGIEVHGQVVVCPGVNDKEVLDETLVGVLDSYPELASIAVVPVGVSKWSKEPTMRPHSAEEAAGVLDAVAYWQQSYLKALGRRMVFAADEYYLLANRCLPEASEYEGFPQHENGIGMARAFREAFLGDKSAAKGVHRGFFSSVDGAPAAGYRAPRVSDLHMTWSMPDHCHGSASSGSSSVIPISLGKGAGSRRGNTPRPGRIEDLPVAIVTAPYGAQVLEPLIPIVDRDDIRIVTVKNETFGGNIAVTGLMSGADIARALSLEPAGHRYLLPDACLSQGRFLDDLTPMDLPRDVEVLPSDGWSLRMALEGVLK
ncbi:MAG: DUF512 domain-containing protein, partial [Actinobacteria bacterium]|nr:DUF512 domain-containing protein [Actinomycetota bacterium]